MVNDKEHVIELMEQALGPKDWCTGADRKWTGNSRLKAEYEVYEMTNGCHLEGIRTRDWP